MDVERYFAARRALGRFTSLGVRAPRITKCPCDGWHMQCTAAPSMTEHLEPVRTEGRVAYRSDVDFDALYPDHVRRLSRHHWTPISVARRAAQLFRSVGARRVLDVGSGAGKFVLAAAAAAPEIMFVGVEQRHHLLATGRLAAAALELTNVRFEHGDATRKRWQRYDGFYFFNPFGENLLAEHARIDSAVELSEARYRADVLRTEERLRAARIGTALVTFNGCSGRVPGSYELLHREYASSDWLRLWVKRCATDDGSYYVEHYDSVFFNRGGGEILRNGRTGGGTRVRR
jgi:predicted RNA methylase